MLTFLLTCSDTITESVVCKFNIVTARITAKNRTNKSGDNTQPCGEPVDDKITSNKDLFTVILGWEGDFRLSMDQVFSTV